VSYALSALIILLASLSLIGVILLFALPYTQSQLKSPKIEVSAEVVKLDGSSLAKVTVFNSGDSPVDISWDQTEIECSGKLSCSTAGSCQSRVNPGQSVECILKCGGVNLLDKCVILVKGKDAVTGSQVGAETWTIVRE